MYLIDKYEKRTFELSSKLEYEFKSEAGEFSDRFEIVFKIDETPNKKKLESDYEYNLVYYSQSTKKLFIKSLTENVDEFRIMNMLGQTVRKLENVSSNVLDNGLSISDMSSGAYIVYFKTGTTTKTKKIIID